MKKKNIAVAILSVFCLLVFMSGVFAQEKAAAEFKKAQLFAKENNTDEAVSAFEKAIKMDHGIGEYHSAYVAYISGNKLFEKGTGFYKALTTEITDNANLWFYYGNVLINHVQHMSSLPDVNMFEMGNVAFAGADNFTKALKIDSMHVQARLFRGITYANFPPMMGFAPTSIKDLTKLIDRFNKSKNNDILSPAYEFLGLAYQQQGDTLKAEKTWKTGRKLFPGSNNFINRLKRLKSGK